MFETSEILLEVEVDWSTRVWIVDPSQNLHDGGLAHTIFLSQLSLCNVFFFGISLTDLTCSLLIRLGRHLEHVQ